VATPWALRTTASDVNIKPRALLSAMGGPSQQKRDPYFGDDGSRVVEDRFTDTSNNEPSSESEE
jgi:hypothetical protein